jgi:transcriptional regulator with XRE-family HTH domain
VVTKAQAGVVAAIESERAAQRLTQAELADRAGISVRALIRYLNLERDLRIPLVERIADALGVDAGALLLGRIERR